MAHYRTILNYVALIALCFFGIPIRVEKPEWSKEDVFREFVEKHNRSYKSNVTEYANRFEIFKESLRVIDELNARRTDDNSAIYGVTQYSDMTRDEYEKLNLSLRNGIKGLQIKRMSNGIPRRHRFHNKYKRLALPLRVDWREKGVITKVRDQGGCGACWAHSTIATIETMLAIKTGKLVELSVQQMVDCSLRNMGCRGGDTCLLLSWLAGDRVSVLPKSEYEKSKQCTGKGIHVSHYSCETLTINEDEMLMALATHGPLTVGVNAISWQNYLGGIIQYHCDGGQDMLNHAVQIVGYDLTGSVPHYILRNSWGPGFGNDGYLYVATGSNVCGVAEEVSAIDVTDL